MSLSKVVIAGHVDHGKSTLIGKILNESNSILSDRYQKIESICRSKSMKFEYAFLLDAFEEEQKQGITIDKLEIPWSYENKQFIFIDTPGHKEFINHMVSGSSNAEVAIVIIDAQEGIREQTKQHVAILNLFGINKIIFTVNKMDLVNYDQNIFNTIKMGLESILINHQFHQVAYLPLSAYAGENIFTPSSKTPWYQGPALVNILLHFSNSKNNLNQFNRLSIQDVYKFDEKRIYAAKVLSGEFQLGDEIYFASSQSHSQLKSIEIWNDKTNKKKFKENDIFAFTTSDAFFLPIGEIVSKNSPPPKKKKQFCLSTYWFSKTLPTINEFYLFKIANQKTLVKLVNFQEVDRNIYDLQFDSETNIYIDYFEENKNLGRGILLHHYDIAAAGIISRHKNDSLNYNIKTKKPFVLWMTGLSGAGKTTLAQSLKQRMANCILLDGDELRQGINADLSFSLEHRLLQATRTAHLANLLAKQGLNVIVSLISPTIESREIAREINKEHHFIEAFIDVPISECAKRDIKGLYKLSTTGNYSNLTGISSPYEPPTSPEIVIDNYQYSVEHNVEEIVSLINQLKE